MILLRDKSKTLRLLNPERSSVLSNNSSRFRERLRVSKTEYLEGPPDLLQLKCRVPPKQFIAKFNFLRLGIVHTSSEMPPHSELFERSRVRKWTNPDSVRQATIPDRFRDGNCKFSMVSQLLMLLHTYVMLNPETLENADLTISESFIGDFPLTGLHKISSKTKAIEAEIFLNSIELNLMDSSS
eukprot:Gb_29056 [translate_table: standard]